MIVVSSIYIDEFILDFMFFLYAVFMCVWYWYNEGK